MINDGNLPDPAQCNQTGVLQMPNTLIYAKTFSPYHYPKHLTPYLFLANFGNFGSYCLNGKNISINDRIFYFLNESDELEINFGANTKLETLIILFNKQFFSDVYSYCKNTVDHLLENRTYDIQENLRLPEVPFIYSEEIRLSTRRILTNQSCDKLSLDQHYFDLLFDLLQYNKKSNEEICRLSAKKRSTREELYKRITMAKIFIEDNLCTTVSIEEMAAEACLNKFHFLKLFKSCFGITPHRYLQKLKMEKSTELLSTGKFSVGEVCRILGFESHGSFNNLYRKFYGVAPSHFMCSSRYKARNHSSNR